MKNRGFYILLGFLLLLVAGGCASRKKNTSQIRAYHAFVARFNTGFNGMEAYKKGYQEQVDGNKDNYLEVLPLLMVGNEATCKMGSSSYKRAIEKAQKTIKQHSIKKKPIRKAGTRLTPKEKAFYAKREFNPYLYKAWFLMGNSYFQEGEFLEASSTYSYMMRLYSGEPDIVAQARLRMAQCYTQLDWFYEAEDLLTKARRDSLPVSQKNNLAVTYADFYIRQKRYKEALPYLEQAVKRHGRSKKEKAREYYLLGQVYKETGNNPAAFRAFKKAIACNPPYELEFNARIRQTETATGRNADRMIKTLESMSRESKNEQYLDQLLYAKGNIYLAKRDTLKALAAYQSGADSSKNSFAKKALLMQLTKLYWARGQYSKAQPCYSSLVGLVTKEDSCYALVNLRSKVLEELVTHTDNIELQDSLQRLSVLPEEELNKVIDKIIADVVKKEEEEKKKAEEQALMDKRNQNLDKTGTNKPAAQPTAALNNKDNSWYFYNPTIVEQGKNTFQQKWGKRKLEDNWRRRNKTVLEGSELSTAEKESADTLARDSAGVARSDSAATADTLSTDTHTREYYKQQIPFTDEQMKASNAILTDALYNEGLIAKDELEDKRMALEAFNRLCEQYPDFEKMEEVYYHLFLLHSRWGDVVEADSCLRHLQEKYPDGKYTLTVSDPDFARNALYGKHLEDSLYALTYDLYKEGRFATVILNDSLSTLKYPMGKHRSKFMFLDAMSRLQTGRQKEFLSLLKDLVSKYPQDEISELAGLIAKGVQEGRLLQSGSFGSIWERRKNTALLSDSTGDSIPLFNSERYTPFYFILAYPQDSVNENQLLFEIARYNFTNYMVRNFDMEFVKDNGIGMLQVKEFINFDEAYMYMKRLYAAAGMAAKLQGMKAVVISKANLELLMKYYSFADYDDFYKKEFQKIPEPEIKGYTLDEPALQQPDKPAGGGNETNGEQEQEQEQEQDGGQ